MSDALAPAGCDTYAVYTSSLSEHHGEPCAPGAQLGQIHPSPERLLEELRKAMQELSHALAHMAAVRRDRYDHAA